MLLLLLPVTAMTAALGAPLDPALDPVSRPAPADSPSASEGSGIRPPAHDACEVPGKAIQWQVDYCLFRSETDDVIAAQPCMDREGTRRFSSECARKRHYKHRLCELQVGAGVREGSIEQCVRDPEFSGRAVRNDGV
ncbi:hypothetical protein [Montanilutibacter psychrotolerans]|nr:hypothetical protein [Lysobacter psychrotolerans]